MHPQSTCSMPDCTRRVLARGLCGAHYQRLMLHGHVLPTTPIRQRYAPDAICSILDCGRPVKSRGLCSMHYQRARINYQPPTQHEIWQSLLRRFWEQVNKNGPIPSNRPELGPCWIWRGKPHAGGYGRIASQHHTYPAHRLSYEIAKGPMPDDLVPDHLCCNPICVNPDHLEAVTEAVNILRGTSPWGLNSRKTHCPRGHAYDEHNTRMYDGRRFCRACEHERGQRRAAEQRRKSA